MVSTNVYTAGRFSSTYLLFLINYISWAKGQQLDPWATADEIVENMIQGGVLIANSLLKFLINYIST